MTNLKRVMEIDLETAKSIKGGGRCYCSCTCTCHCGSYDTQSYSNGASNGYMQQYLYNYRDS